jgi:hypothetical protein
MPLKIEATWFDRVELNLTGKRPPKYGCNEIDVVPKLPGAYAFFRIHGRINTCLYVGRSDNLRRRLKQHLNKSAELMDALYHAGTGMRVFVGCTVNLKKDSNKLDRVLKVLETSLINYAISEGQQLLNKRGTKRPSHEIRFSRSRFAERIVERQMIVPVSIAGD